MKANRKFSKDEEAVSPVIGVILMVAITVILAAVIAAFVFGMGSSLKKNYVVAATASQITTSSIDITYMGGPDADSLDYMFVQVIPGKSGATNPTNVYFNGTNTTNVEADGMADVMVGTTASVTAVTAGDFAERDHVVVTATFLDGLTQVIVDTYV